ncbi:MAG: glycosyltransferase family 2 protein [Candidatus Thiothrix putei]|jgi:Glycosyltransferases involved in cell wall biogenesis|uniref:Glycosyl transferase family 2 n=2 Tax=Thiothrix TaxID=1030 RepID=A0A1H3VHR6_9GAMM|nr:glycosyltransferase family 2 protein [Thiothrix caldifontis]WGZ96517.1 MAG: glycosyltransferase family 2 protein [Candidatus Thiothrix putei]SDZ74290.1 Glycosyl transferase family 2 [Thiothrix caldifontis]
MDSVRVQILLSTWNGERWLPELLASLERQTFQDWQLLIRDDGSTDQTLRILLKWQAAYPEKLAGLLLDGSHLGSKLSFSRLVEASTAPCLMFCDQDDVWFPEKVELQYTALRRLEAQYGEESPLLVHSDLVVVDQGRVLQTVSFWDYRGFEVNQRKQAYLLNNVVTGCATAFNRAAAQLAFPLPVYAMEHDRWLALVCAWFGQIQPLPHPLLLYRQHEDNEIGAEPATVNGLSERVEAWSQQADVFLHRFGEQLDAEDYKLVEAVAGLRHLRGWKRRQHILHHRLFKQGVLNNVALLLFA